MKKYRVRVYDTMEDIWVLEKRVLWLFWSFIGCGSKDEVTGMMNILNEE